MHTLLRWISASDENEAWLGMKTKIHSSINSRLVEDHSVVKKACKASERSIKTEELQEGSREME